jgi:hypothetical protein
MNIVQCIILAREFLMRGNLFCAYASHKETEVSETVVSFTVLLDDMV